MGSRVFTVCAAADSGVLWTGVRLLLLLSHKTICPEYVPPTTRLGWNLANPTDITSDWRRKWHNSNTSVSLLLMLALWSLKQLIEDEFPAGRLRELIPYLAVEDVLRCALLVLHVPDQRHSVRLMRSILIVVIWGHQQLWILRGAQQPLLDVEKC